MSASKVRWLELSQLSLCSEFDKENSMEFSLISLPTYTFYYCGYTLTLPWSSSYSSHVTHCDLWPVTWLSVTIHHTIVTLWQSHITLSCAPLCSYKSKKKKKKRNINNDLAILPSHDIGDGSKNLFVYETINGGGIMEAKCTRKLSWEHTALCLPPKHGHQHWRYLASKYL